MPSPPIRLVVALLPFALCVVSCSRSDVAPAAVDLQAVRDTVIALESAMNLAVDALDCESGLETLGDKEPLFVSSGYVVRTGAELREMCGQMVAARTGAHFDVDALSANVLSEDVAFVVREGNYTIDLVDGTSPRVYLVMTTIWQREQDGWKMVHLHESVIPPSQSDSTTVS